MQHVLLFCCTRFHQDLGTGEKSFFFFFLKLNNFTSLKNNGFSANASINRVIICL